MKIRKLDGLEVVDHPTVSCATSQLISTSSHSHKRLWVGNRHLLDVTEVQELRARLTAWLKTGSLRIGKDDMAEEEPVTNG